MNNKIIYGRIIYSEIIYDIIIMQHMKKYFTFLLTLKWKVVYIYKHPE